MNGFNRIAAAVPQLLVADPFFNAEKILALYKQAAEKNASLCLFPELALTGCSCGDLFEQKKLLDDALSALETLAQETASYRTILAVGLPILCGRRLFNAVAVCSAGKVSGFAVKNFIPSFREHGETRYFSSASALPENFILPFGRELLPFDSDIVFETPDFSFSIVFGSDIASVTSPAAACAAAGAQLILVPASETETVFASDERRTLLKSESSRLTAAIALANAGVHESSGEALYAGEALIAVNGKITAANTPFDRCGNVIFSDFKPAWIDLHRRAKTNFNDAPVPQFRQVALEKTYSSPDLEFSAIEQNPFIPADPGEADRACSRIFDIQAAALAKRFLSCGAQRMVLGLSGGLDSTLALLVAVRCCDLLQLPRKTVCSVTMPGFGTSGRTRNNAALIAEAAGTELRTIPINDAVMQHFKDIGHDPENHNVVYENSQARERTQILMDVANALNGIVIGTGDLSEIALGWSTFNGDHMSMYCVNCDVPKTLMRSMVLSAAAQEHDTALANALRDICNTPVSPELLPGAQHTENIIGSYQLHDFFLWYFIHYGEDQDGLIALASAAFKDTFPQEEISRTCSIFFRRFMTQQFKRNAAPEGPRISPVSLNASSSWRMPSDSAFFSRKKSLAKKSV